MQRVTHVKHITLVLIRLELQQSATDFLGYNFVKSELAIFSIDFIKDVFVFFHLFLRRENFKANQLVADGQIKLLALFLAINNLGKLICLSLKQISDQTIIEIFLQFFQLLTFGFWIPRFS